MTFNPISVNSKTYGLRAPGSYVLSTAVFSDPLNEFRIRAGSKTKAGEYTFGVTRYLQKDVTEGSAVVRKNATVTISVSLPATGFSVADVDGLASDLSEFLTTETISRLLQGES